MYLLFALAFPMRISGYFSHLDDFLADFFQWLGGPIGFVTREHMDKILRIRLISVYDHCPTVFSLETSL